MAVGTKLPAHDLLGFSEALLNHSKDFWSSLLDSVSRHSASAVFLDAQGSEASLAATNLLVQRLEEHRNRVFRLTHREPSEQLPGFLAFEELVDRLREQPGWFRTEGLPQVPEVFHRLEACTTYEEFDTLLERHWEEFSPLLWGRNCVEVAERTAQQILEHSRDVQRLHLVFEQPKLWDTHLFNVILILFRNIVRSESLNTPVLWFLSNREDPEAHKYTELLHSLLRLDSSRIQRHPVPSPNPHAVRMFIDGRASPLQKPKSEKLALDIILAATNLYEEKECDNHYFVPTIWKRACQAHVPNFFEETTSNDISEFVSAPPLGEADPQLDLLFRACRFQEIQRTLGGQGSPGEHLTPLSTYLVALSLWYAPNRDFEQWNSSFFKDGLWRRHGLFTTVTLLRVCAFFREFQAISETRAQVMESLPPAHALHMHMALIDLLLARMLGDGEATRQLQLTLENLMGSRPLPKVPATDLAELETILITSRAVNLCFLNPETESPEIVAARIREVEADAALYRRFARTAPLLLPLFSHSVITVNNTVGDNSLDLDPIEMLKTELETRYRIYPISEQCLHLGNLATELAESGLYSEACDRIGESLAIAKYSGDATYRAYARHDYINTRYQGGLVPPDFREWLEDAHAILEAANIPLEFWRTQALEIITLWYASSDRSEAHSRAMQLLEWTKSNRLDIPFELVQENPIELLAAVTGISELPTQIPPELQHCPEAIELQVSQALAQGRFGDADTILMDRVAGLKTKRPTRAATTINTLAYLGTKNGISAQVRTAIRQETLERFTVLYFQGWRHFSERFSLLASPCIQAVLAFPPQEILKQPDSVVRTASEGLSLISDSRDLRLSLAMVLRFLVPTASVSVFTRKALADETQMDHPYSGTRISDAEIREHEDDRRRIAWVIADCFPTQGELNLHHSHRPTPGPTKRRSSNDLLWVSNDVSIIRAGAQLVLSFRSAPLFAIVACENSDAACTGLVRFSEIGSLPLLLVAVRMSLDRIAERERILTLEREADSIAERRSAMARELSELLGKEREKLYSDLLSTNRSLEKLSRRLEAALTITREMYVAGHRVQAILKAAGHILRSLAWKEPCYVEAWMHESFGKKTGRYAHCNIQGIEALTRLAEQNASNAERIRIEIVDVAPQDFPPDTLRASALAGCSIANGILSIPVCHKGYGLALLHIGGVDARFFTTDDEDFIDTLVHSLGIVLSNMEFLEAEKEALVELVNKAIAYGPRLHRPILELGNIARTLELNQDFVLHRSIHGALGRISEVARDLSKMEFIAGRIGRIKKEREEDPDSGVS